MSRFTSFLSWVLVVWGSPGLIRNKQISDSLKSNKEQDDDWAYGDQWKEVPPEVDLTGWTKLIAQTSSYDNIYSRGLYVFQNNRTDMIHIQSLLLEKANVTSLIVPDVGTSGPVEALYVKSEDVAAARKALDSIKDKL